MKQLTAFIASSFLFFSVAGCADGISENQGNADNQNNSENQGNSGNQSNSENQGNSGNQSNSGNQNNQSAEKTDEDWARARISQTAATEDAFRAIAYSGGFPVITDEKTVIFMHWHEGGSWAVAGGFNGWTPQPMTQTGDIWHAEAAIPDGLADLGYKFVNAENGQTVYEADPWALRFGYDENGELSYLRAPDKPHLMRWNDFRSPQGLSSRAIRVYVPQNCDPCAVLYAQDGQNLFRNDDSSWKLPAAMDAIGGDFLIVGIDSTPDRFAEYAHADDEIEYGGQSVKVSAKGAVYADFVDQTVRPFIESEFRTSEKAGLMGSSLGGLISLYIALRFPGRYAAALALSPTTAWGDFSLHTKTIADLYKEAGHGSAAIYADSGGGEGSGCKFTAQDALEDENSRDNYCTTKKFAETLASVGYAYDVDLFHWHEPGAQHNEAAWAARVFRPLGIFKNLP